MSNESYEKCLENTDASLGKIILQYKLKYITAINIT